MILRTVSNACPQPLACLCGKCKDPQDTGGDLRVLLKTPVRVVAMACGGYSSTASSVSSASGASSTTGSGSGSGWVFLPTCTDTVAPISR